MIAPPMLTPTVPTAYLLIPLSVSPSVWTFLVFFLSVLSLLLLILLPNTITQIYLVRIPFLFV
jgi:hypothetical protein